jgi:exopolysaccharide biosynthesis WecB/TagA/CpsF family protein
MTDAAPGLHGHETTLLPVADVAGIPVHLASWDAAVEVIADAAGSPHEHPLAVASINLDHIHHFGAAHHPAGSPDADAPEWLNLIDGAPIAAHISRLRGDNYPRLAGSDLIGPILDEADASRLSVGVLGGSDAVHAGLLGRFGSSWPHIRFTGHWVPDREALGSDAECALLAEQIARTRTDILLVCLGKPRQERWIDTYGAASGARVLLAFGAVVDFLAGQVGRAPTWVSRAGMEWAWRLMLEPRRLSRRYLVQGPSAYLEVRRSTGGAVR